MALSAPARPGLVTAIGTYRPQAWPGRLGGVGKQVLGDVLDGLHSPAPASQPQMGTHAQARGPSASAASRRGERDVGCGDRGMARPVLMRRHQRNLLQQLTRGCAALGPGRRGPGHGPDQGQPGEVVEQDRAAAGCRRAGSASSGTRRVVPGMFCGRRSPTASASETPMSRASVRARYAVAAPR